jgi:hypothetical protein
MRSLIAISFLSIYLLAHTELHQIIKLPVLFSHYQDHRQSNTLSFLEFLSLHYASHHADEDQQHENLPFQDNDFHVIHFSLIAIPGEPFDVLAYTAPSAQPVAFNYPFFIPTSGNKSIWQPPRF